MRPNRRSRFAAVRVSVRRTVLLRRRLIAAVLLGLAVLAGLRATAPAPPETVGVTVAARALAAGSELQPGDLATVELSPGAVPSGVVADPAGRLLASPLSRGEPITDVRLVGPAMTAGTPGLVAVPIRLPDAGMASLLRVGDRIDVLAVNPQGGPGEAPLEVAPDALVLALPQPDAAAASDGLQGRLVVLGVMADDARPLAAAGVTLLLTFALAD